MRFDFPRFYQIFFIKKHHGALHLPKILICYIYKYHGALHLCEKP
jgi:hypothetical protein